MGTDSAVAITAGTGTDIDTFLLAGGGHQQIIREARATAVASINNWTVSTTASTSQIASDVNRVCMLIASNASARVYLRFDSTAPTSSVFHWFLDPGDRFEVPWVMSTLAVSMLGQSAGGNILSTLATAT